MSKKRWLFEVQHFDEKSKLMTIHERSRTKPLTLVEFNKMLKKRFAPPMYKSFCYTVTTPGWKL